MLKEFKINSLSILNLFEQKSRNLWHNTKKNRIEKEEHAKQSFLHRQS